MAIAIHEHNPQINFRFDTVVSLLCGTFLTKKRKQQEIR